MASIRTIKKKVKELVERDDIEGLKQMLKDSQRVLSVLFSMTYDKSYLIAWKAIKAYGQLLIELAERQPQLASEQIRRLLWSITEESGGLGWAAIEILAEVICNAGGKMNALVPLLAQYAEEPPFVPSVLYALTRLTECLGILPWSEEEVIAIIENAQKLDTPDVHGYVILAYATIKDLINLKPLQKKVLMDERPFLYFDGRKMIETSPKKLAEQYSLL